jgi:predicted nucleotidyltransferase component of viral defense system
METVPLADLLKRRVHRLVALTQDLIVAQAFEVFPDCVLHGGTAIWRCYGGGRLSEDVDAYLPSYRDTSGTRFRDGLGAKGLAELKYKATRNTVFGKFKFSETTVSFEAAIRRPPAKVVRPYAMLSGGFMLVNTLPPEALVAEKSAAYLSRRKVRDLYDVFFLLNFVEDRPTAARSLTALIRDYKKPEDEGQLKAIVVTGAIPSAESMIESIRAWARKST